MGIQAAPVHSTDNLANMCQLSGLGASTSCNTHGLSRPVKGIALPYLQILFVSGYLYCVTVTHGYKFRSV